MIFNIEPKFRHDDSILHLGQGFAFIFFFFHIFVIIHNTSQSSVSCTPTVMWISSCTHLRRTHCVSSLCLYQKWSNRSLTNTYCFIYIYYVLSCWTGASTKIDIAHPYGPYCHGLKNPYIYVWSTIHIWVLLQSTVSLFFFFPSVVLHQSSFLLSSAKRSYPKVREKKNNGTNYEECF